MEQFTLLPSVQSNIQVTGMLPAATQNRHERQIISFPETKFSCIELLLLFLCYWCLGKGKKKKKKDTDGRDTILLQKQVNAGPSLACQALCEACIFLILVFLGLLGPRLLGLGL